MPDRLKSHLLRELWEEIATITKGIFDRPLQTGKLPVDWMKANDMPVLKKGDESLASNYIPISLIVKHLDGQVLMYDLQHGFREKRSCETQLIMFIEDLTRNASLGNKTDIILFDFSLGCLARSVTCLATDACLTADPGVASSITFPSHTFVEIDHEIISTVILFPSAYSFKKGCCLLQAKYVHELLVNCLFKPAQEKSVVRQTDRPAMTIAFVLGRKATKQTHKQNSTFQKPLIKSITANFGAASI